MKQPAIKWTGSKRSQMNDIISYFPKNIDTYYEPFCGGCSILLGLIQNSTIHVNHFECSDINKDLINLWNVIKNNHKELIKSYYNLYHQLNKDNDIERRKNFYYEIRNRLNKEHNPFDFNFIMRNAINGMPRYNKNGEFNSPFHFNRKGIIPDNFSKIINYWHDLLNEKDVIFSCKDYKDINPNENDFLYLDPPYANSKSLYFGCINLDILWNYLSNVKCHYALSFDGKVGDNNMTVEIPHELYNEHLYIESGKSSFRKLINTVVNNKEEKVYESLYIK